jgi:hypothetical protein
MVTATAESDAEIFARAAAADKDEIMDCIKTNGENLLTNGKNNTREILEKMAENEAKAVKRHAEMKEMQSELRVSQQSWARARRQVEMAQRDEFEVRVFQHMQKQQIAMLEEVRRLRSDAAASQHTSLAEHAKHYEVIVVLR